MHKPSVRNPGVTPDGSDVLRRDSEQVATELGVQRNSACWTESNKKWNSSKSQGPSLDLKKRCPLPNLHTEERCGLAAPHVKAKRFSDRRAG